MIEPQPSVIIIADDNPDDVFFASRCIQQCGFKQPIVVAEDGADAVEYLKNCIQTGKLPCAVFLDIKMPVLTGFDALAWARSQPELASVPILMMSGSDLPQDKEKARMLGANGY